jgi:predicted nucleic acid-binding protein
VAGNLTTDAHLAAIAIEHQYELHSNDTDFAASPASAGAICSQRDAGNPL